MFASQADHLFPEETKGDGNCPFNAFILGLSHQSVIENMDMGFTRVGESPDVSMKEFIRDAADKLNIPSRWAMVKRELLALRQNSKTTLQNKFAPILRNLAIGLAENDAEHESRTIEPLLSAFDDYVELQGGRARSVVADDIFKYHPFIQNKFAEFYNQKNKFNDVANELKRWWCGADTPVSGYQQFLKEMKKDGKWAGDLELFQLARYFRINLDVLRQNFVHRIYSHSGKVPCRYFSDDQIAQLIDRQIINSPVPGADEIAFLPLKEDEVVQRLQPVPEFDKVSWYIVENESIKGMLVPKEWSDCLRQLWLRNVIEKKNDRYVFSVDREVAIKYAAGLPDRNKIINLWRQFHCEAPTVTLSNPEAVHWSNVVSQEESSSIPSVYSYYQSFMSFVTDKFFSKSTIKRTPFFFKTYFDDGEARITAAPSDLELRRNKDI